MLLTPCDKRRNQGQRHDHHVWRDQAILRSRVAGVDSVVDPPPIQDICYATRASPCSRRNRGQRVGGVPRGGAPGPPGPVGRDKGPDQLEEKWIIDLTKSGKSVLSARQEGVAWGAVTALAGPWMGIAARGL